jgi:hypothetical protein
MKARMTRLKAVLSAALLCAVVVPALAGAGRTADGTEPEALPNDLPAIRWVVVERNGRKAVGTSARVDCSKFVISQRAAVRHLKASVRISKWDYNHTIAWLSCFSDGRIGFADGRSAYWSIGEGGGSSVRFDEGEERYLYCDGCRLPHTGSWLHDYENK